jgi:hypothetical protein
LPFKQNNKGSINKELRRQALTVVSVLDDVLNLEGGDVIRDDGEATNLAGASKWKLKSAFPVLDYQSLAVWSADAVMRHPAHRWPTRGHCLDAPEPD